MMPISRTVPSLFLAAATLFAVPHAYALSAKECHAKFQVAKKDGTLNGQKYKDFKAAQCGTDATPATVSGAQNGAAAAEKTPATPAGKSEPASPGPGLTSKPTTVASGNAVFPSSVSAQYAKLSPGVARRKTCLDQYHANKSTGGNGGLKWIQKGGGYYSQCNAKLKG